MPEPKTSGPVTQLQIVADLVEPVLSGQYGREVAEDVAREIIEALALVAPLKWEIGRDFAGRQAWYRNFVFAEDEVQALARAREVDDVERLFGREAKNIVRRWVDA